MSPLKSITLTSLLLLSSAAAFSASIPDTLRIGTDPTYAPFESKTPEGKVVGFDIDLTNALCERMKTRCVIVESPFDALIPSLKAKKIDAIVAAMNITPARLQQISFTDRLYSTRARLVAAKGTTIEPKVDALRGKNVGVLQGSIQEAYANKYWRPEGVNVISYQSQNDVYSDLTATRLDAAFQDEVAGSHGFLKQDAGKGYDFAGPAVTDPQIFGEGVGMGLRKEDVELQKAINEAFQSLRADGTYQKIVARYFSFDIY